MRGACSAGPISAALAERELTLEAQGLLERGRIMFVQPDVQEVIGLASRSAVALEIVLVENFPFISVFDRRWSNFVT